MLREGTVTVTVRSRDRRLLLFSGVCVGVLLVIVARHLFMAPSSKPTAKAADAPVEDERLTPVENTVLVATTVSTPASSPEQRPRLHHDSELAEPVPTEATGLFQKAYERWSTEPEDFAATHEAEKMFVDAFDRLSIHALGQHISCGNILCRGRFEFTELSELYKMRQIQEPDGIRVASTLPIENGGTTTVSVYWTRNPNPVGPLTDTLGD